MNSIAKSISLVALLATIAPCVLYFAGILELAPMKWVALAATIVWFAVTPLWMGRELQITDDQPQI